MTELVYDEGAREVIAKRWPDAVFSDASDYIHLGRFEVSVEAEPDEFYPFMIQEGWARACFGFELTLR